MIRVATEEDATAISSIYNYYVTNSVVTFEELPVSALDMEERMTRVKKNYPWLVYVLKDEIVGYAYAEEWKTRSAYRYSVESTVYLKPGHEGNGFGYELYRKLIAQLKKQKIHVAIAGISLPNPISIKLHKKCGYKQTGIFREVGYKFGRWVDVAYWELHL